MPMEPHTKGASARAETRSGPETEGARLAFTIGGFVLALVLTGIGLKQSLVYMDVPLVPLALWFPVVAITKAREMPAIGWALIQFPIFALLFALGIRRWRVGWVLVALVAGYAILVVVALEMVRERTAL